MDGAVLCPRCGVVMDLHVESERLSDGTRRIVYYYRCRRCGYRLQDLEILVRKNGKGLELRTVEYVYKKAARSLRAR